jgi:hypothetical protein
MLDIPFRGHTRPSILVLPVREHEQCGLVWSPVANQCGIGPNKQTVVFRYLLKRISPLTTVDGVTVTCRESSN